MRGRGIQSSGPLRYAIVDGVNVRDSRVYNYPPRWNAAPSQELLVIRGNYQTDEVSLDSCAGAAARTACSTDGSPRAACNESLYVVIRHKGHFDATQGLPRGRDYERRLTADIIELARQYGRYDCRKIAEVLRQAGWTINDKRVERIWQREG
jgi:hypothetical protein